MNTTRMLLRHFLAALAYRTQKALRDAPTEFSDFREAQTFAHRMNSFGT